MSFLDSKFEDELYSFDDSKDKRQRKTRKAVELAFLELLQEKNFEQITITEVTNKADINRKTFYNNYYSLDDIVKSIEKKMSALLFSKLPYKITVQNEIEIYNILLEFTNILMPYKNVLQKISINRGETVFFKDVQAAILPYIEHSMMGYHIDAAVIPYVGKFIINGMTAIFYEWLGSDNLDPEQVAKLCYNLITASIKLENYEKI